MASTDINLHLPSRYLPESEESTLATPPLDLFCRTWAVTHSTLSMWRSAKNVRITYKDLGDSKVDDLVEYEKKGSLKNVKGVDKLLGPGSWNWRGSGLLKLITSHWEVLGFGELATGERWMVIWFAKTLFTEEGVDVLTDEQAGLPEPALNTILDRLAKLDHVGKIVEKDMKPVDIKLPWTLKDA
ncbi:hypothetical protein SCAR479_04177 [Seiridium cardinale]|uniref:Uncharacterized protein n=1 Tax=Seiridium cardinale TaxID=138064 RepID=A0ABR2XYS5_9PEZI